MFIPKKISSTTTTMKWQHDGTLRERTVKLANDGTPVWTTTAWTTAAVTDSKLLAHVGSSSSSESLARPRSLACPSFTSGARRGSMTNCLHRITVRRRHRRHRRRCTVGESTVWPCGKALNDIRFNNSNLLVSENIVG